MTMVYGTTTEPATEPNELTSGHPEDAGGGFKRLNPADGLFLRAQHLSVMQEYSASLAAAVGAGLGPGVAHGFICTLADNTVYVSDGLGFADGRPLRSTQPASISLKNLTASTRDFWIVEVVFKEWPIGSEPVYGGLCEDPCGHGSGIKPFEAEGIEVTLRHEVLDRVDNDPHLRWNRLASSYFERERENGGELAPSDNAPWLLPGLSSSILALDGNPWGRGTGPHTDKALPIGVVWNFGTGWMLDTWIARRDLGEPTPEAAWQWRLGWRPRNVFVAQVLQFQAQLAASSFGATVAAPAELKVLKGQAGRAFQTIDTLVHYADDPTLTEEYKATVDAFERLYEQAVLENAGESLSLQAAGFAELPPAGYLPFELETQEVMENRATRIFGLQVDVHVRVCRADYVAHAVEQVQHMDRIPLDAPLKVRPKVDLLVPDRRLIDFERTQPRDPYGWAAFVRRREEVGEQPRDPVEVWVLDIDEGQEAVLSRYGRANRSQPALFQQIFGDSPYLRDRQGFKSFGVAEYPAAEWGVPTGSDGKPDQVWRDVHEVITKSGAPCLAVLGIANQPERQALAATRAGLFIVPDTDDSWAPVRLPLTFVVPGSREAIVICVRAQNDR